MYASWLSWLLSMDNSRTKINKIMNLNLNRTLKAFFIHFLAFAITITVFLFLLIRFNVTCYRSLTLIYCRSHYFRLPVQHFGSHASIVCSDSWENHVGEVWNLVVEIFTGHSGNKYSVKRSNLEMAGAFSVHSCTNLSNVLITQNIGNFGA